MTSLVTVDESKLRGEEERGLAKTQDTISGKQQNSAAPTPNPFDDEEEEPKKRSPPKKRAVKRSPPKKRTAPVKRKAVKKKSD